MMSKVSLGIRGKENFIPIGELHNSRSAIKFIIDNIKILIPNDGRKTYFLTEFLPTDMILVPDSKNEFKYLKCKIKLSQMDRDKLNKDVAQRESDKIANEDKYTLEKLFEMLFSLKCELHSIEKQDESSAKLFTDIQKGNLDAFEKRVNQINELAFNKAKGIMTSSPQLAAERTSFVMLKNK